MPHSAGKERAGLVAPIIPESSGFHQEYFTNDFLASLTPREKDNIVPSCFGVSKTRGEEKMQGKERKRNGVQVFINKNQPGITLPIA